MSATILTFPTPATEQAVRTHHRYAGPAAITQFEAPAATGTSRAPERNAKRPPTPFDSLRNPEGMQIDPRTTSEMVAFKIVKAILKGAKWLIINEGWTRSCAAEDVDNRACAPDDPRAARWNADGAIARAALAWRKSADEKPGADNEAKPTEAAITPSQRRTGHLHRQRAGVVHVEEAMAYQAVVNELGVTTKGNPREVVAMWGRHPKRRAQHLIQVFSDAIESVDKLERQWAREADSPKEKTDA